MSEPKQRRLVLCSGADGPSGAETTDGRRILRLDAISENGDTNLRLSNITEALKNRLPDRLIDLLEIATYVYTADCDVSRERAWIDDKSTEPWVREFELVVPVRDLEFWGRAEVVEALTSALEFLSSDRFAFRFVRLRRRPLTNGYLELVQLQDEPFYGAERVVMFSGGLDSLAGAIETASRGDPLVLVSHRPAPQIGKRQRVLVETLSGRLGVPVRHIPVWVNKSGHDNESTQRTRSFLFSALGAVVAKMLNAGGVRFYENGVISLNWPLADEAMLSRASRTTHPETMRRLESLLRLVTDRADFVVDNPFVYHTKTDVVASIASSGYEELIGLSCSCARTMFQTATQPHCGICGQCIDRWVALSAAGLMGTHYSDDYTFDPFTVRRTRTYDHNIAVNYVRFASDMAGKDENWFGSVYSLELSRAARWFPNAAEAAMKLIAMHQRHAGHVLAEVEEQLRAHGGDFARGSLEPTSLLAMVGRQEHRGPAVSPYQASRSVPEDHVSDPGNGFRFSNDYRQVEIGSQRYSLTPAQAAAIRELHRSLLEGQPVLASAELLTAMGELAPTRLSDIFRYNDPRKSLVKRVGKDCYCLNI